MTFGIIGNGFVGKATQLLKSDNHPIKIYDSDPDKCSPPNITLSDLMDCHIIFISVPTPSNPDGSCHLKIVQSVIENIRALGIRAHIVIRSTVEIGTSDALDCYFMPEFLTEKNWMDDFQNCNNWIFGLRKTDLETNQDFIHKITAIINHSHEEGNIKFNKITFVPNKEPKKGNTVVEVKVRPNTRVAYWASSPKNYVPQVEEAYGDFSNSGVVTSNNIGVAKLVIEAGTSYIVPSGREINRHIHYRELDLPWGMMGDIKTRYY